MAEQTIGTSAWESVITTTAETVFQNQSVDPIFITTEATGSLDTDQGFLLLPNDSIVIDTGVDVSAIAHRQGSKLFYMEIQ